eukprot:2349543-Prymnesium_polylepis.1
MGGAVGKGKRSLRSSGHTATHPSRAAPLPHHAHTLSPIARTPYLPSRAHPISHRTHPIRSHTQRAPPSPPPRSRCFGAQLGRPRSALAPRPPRAGPAAAPPRGRARR